MGSYTGLNELSKEFGTNVKYVTADVDTGIVMTISNQLSNIESMVSSTTIEVPSKIANYDAGVGTAVSEAKGDIERELYKIKHSMNNVLKVVAELDEYNDYEDHEKGTFVDFANAADEIIERSKAIRATEEFFRKRCKIEGDYAIMYIDGKKCIYDMKNHKFYANGIISKKEALDVTIYLPSGAKEKDYRNLNTYTFFAEPDAKDKKKKESRKSSKVIENCEIDTISIQVLKKPGTNTPFTQFDEVATLTKFINKAADTDLTKCKNVIGGDSKYGPYAIKIAANATNSNSELYQTIYCVNNAVILDDAPGGEKTRITSEELHKLNRSDVDIYFITTSNDPNIYSNESYDVLDVRKRPSLYEVSYFVKGIKTICEECSNAKIHVVYNQNNGRDYLVSALKNFENTYDNYSYEGEYWYDFSPSNYVSHTDGNILIGKLSEAKTTSIHGIYERRMRNIAKVFENNNDSV